MKMIMNGLKYDRDKAHTCAHVKTPRSVERWRDQI